MAGQSILEFHNVPMKNFVDVLFQQAMFKIHLPIWEISSIYGKAEE